ncbi:MAG TPA: LysR family transcriptional regulator [Ktedonobacteraceae bacterium]|jgi:DNA-binding transcriptional LysR family regulator|nr:LysR family transcriptional regulator [Ktedonobacteraceae bacterium]
MNLYHLRVFLTVAEHEHITRASEELILSQPAVTKIIQNLEHEVGLELIERHGRRIVLTHAGHLLHRYARRMFALEREMEEALSALKDIESGEITLAANTTTGVYLLPPIVARFRARYPQVTLHINILNSHEIVEQILNWNLDFGLVESDPATLPPGLQVEVFAYDELVMVVAPRHRWSQLDSLEPEALRNEELVLREQGSGIREVIEHALFQHGVQVSPLLTIPDNEAIKQMVMSGVGAAILSRLTVQRELAAGNLVHIPINGMELHPQLSLIRRTDKQLSRAAQAFCALLKPPDKEIPELQQATEIAKDNEVEQAYKTTGKP